MKDRFQTINAVHWLAVIAVFASFLLMYAPMLPDMIGRWDDPDFSHCFKGACGSRYDSTGCFTDDPDLECFN
ncbi:MAG: hypothetical protein R6T90_02240 [Dissulfuribacterales bacterium]